MFGAIKHLFQPTRNTANSAQVVEPTPPSESLHWPASGMFQVQVVDESYYRDAISHVAQNEDGKTAMVFCTARLVPEDSNPHDQNAVAVYFEDAKVGHLSRQSAIEFRSALSRFENRTLSETTCDAVITNGLVADGEAYEYSIELDLELHGDVPQLMIPKYFEVARQDSSPPLQPRSAGLFEITVWLPHNALGNMHKKQHVESWTTEHWDSINYYLLNRQGIGLGHKLVEIPKATHARLFGEQEPEVSVVTIEGRTVTLLFKRFLLSGLF